jgi:hypothetical protein
MAAKKSGAKKKTEAKAGSKASSKSKTKKKPAAKKATAAKKAPAAKKAAAKKTPAKRAPAKKAPAKKAPAKKAPAKKALAKKAPAKATAKKAVPQQAVAPSKAESESKATPAKKGAGFSSNDVNMGQIFALRPRVSTSFRQDDFRTARHQLAEESFKDASEAARAVAEKALELSHDGVIPGRKKRRGSRPF